MTRKKKRYKTTTLLQFSLPKRKVILPKPMRPKIGQVVSGKVWTGMKWGELKPKTTPKPKAIIPLTKIRSLYKIKVSVRRGGKPRTSHPWFHVAGGLLGSTKPSTRTVVELSEKLTWADKRDLEKRLGRWGFTERRKSFRIYWEKIATEPYAKIDTKQQIANLKQEVKEHWHGRIDPFAKINIEFGEYK